MTWAETYWTRTGESLSKFGIIYGSRNWTSRKKYRKIGGPIHKYLSLLLNTTGLNEILAEELAILPGMEEVSLLLYINQYVQRKKFEVIILDCAPTGESLRFISIPTTLEWYMSKVFKMERTLVKVARPIAKRIYNVPLPGDDYFETLEKLFERLKGVDQILTDPQCTSVRLVANPEKIVLKETQRAYMYFCLYRMHIDAIVLNRIFRKGSGTPTLRNGKKTKSPTEKRRRNISVLCPSFRSPSSGRRSWVMNN